MTIQSRVLLVGVLVQMTPYLALTTRSSFDVTIDAETKMVIPLVEERLKRFGVHSGDITFAAEETSRDGLQNQSNGVISSDVINIKTLIWEVDDVSVGSKPPFYVATAVKSEDMVDQNRLKSLILKENSNCNDQASFVGYRLSLAPQATAEELTGFRSGCMPPICHSTNLQLYVDSSIFPHNEHLSVDIDQDNDHGKRIMVSLGSGIRGKNLVVPLNCVCQVASKTGGVCVGPIIQEKNVHKNDDSAAAVKLPNGKLEAKADRMRRLPQPMDRLKEYRGLDSMVEKAKLFRSTARNKERFKEFESLLNEAINCGELSELLKSKPEYGVSKTALHMAAWRGDIRSVQLLIDKSNQHCPEIDAINLISRSEGNYGKTAIFYALTQCREDVVRRLADLGANLLIVNNKGQTPCSIAISHLSKDTCQYLIELETKQLRNGGKFLDYRKSHSDEKLYGDLDPRFPIDKFNYGEDLTHSLEEFCRSVQQAKTSTIINGIPTDFAPRSLRPTVRWWNRKDASLEAANSSNKKNALKQAITFTQPRPTTREKVSPEASKDIAPGLQDPPKQIDVNSLELLDAASVLDAGTDVVIVNCSNSIALLEEEIDQSIASFTHTVSQAKHVNDEIRASFAWGLDCEWEPGFDRGKNHPVATLQLSTRRRAFLVDVQCLCQSNSENSERVSALTDVQTKLNATLARLFIDNRLAVVGFGIMQDLGKLAASFPKFTCFSNFSEIIDLQAMATLVFPKNTRQLLSSLRKMVAWLLSRRLDKTQQCSAWTQRPLTEAQINYATLDAAVLPLLLETMVHNSTIVERYGGQFFSVHSNLFCNVRYVLVQETKTGNQSNEEVVWNVPMGNVRKTLGLHIARQCWPSNQPTPPLPRLMVLNQNRTSKKERAHAAKVSLDNGTTRPKPIALKTLIGDLSNLPIPGISLGYTKDSCAERVLGHTFMNTIPKGTHIGFNRRSGVIETKNAFLIFCNFGAGSLEMKKFHEGKQFRGSAFSGGGRFLSFHVNPSRKNGSERVMADFVKESLSSFCKNEDEKVILLFARNGSSSKYIYCGYCHCVEYTTADDGDRLDLNLELLNYNTLSGEERISDSFVELVKSQSKPHVYL